MNKVIAVCTSKEKGVRKQVVPEVQLKENFGVLGDAHADSQTHRQVSLLAVESIAKMKKHGLNLSPGDFAENITTEGINLVSIPVGTKVAVGDKVVLEISQIGKECHTGCAIKKQVGKCIMPVEGVFGRVVKGGPVKAGDEIKII
ncbi:MAG: MOSC domain-containing protein [Dehalococcoidales bacterium]|nr:MOSC domain-containing protein [Dehalococcoidales bacterium]